MVSRTIALLGVLAAAQAASAAVLMQLNSFENSGDLPAPTASLTFSQGATGVTDGSSSLQVQGTGDNNWGFHHLGSFSALDVDTTLPITVYMAATAQNLAGGGNYSVEFRLTTNEGGLDGTESPAWGQFGIPFPNNSGGTTLSSSWPWVNGGQTTVTVNTSQVVTALAANLMAKYPSAASFTLDARYRGVAAGEALFIDNVQVEYTAIPEPASLGLLGLAGLGLIRRRRA